MVEDSDKNVNKKLISTVQELIDKDQALREKYSVGERFQMIGRRLRGLLKYLKENADVGEGSEAVLDQTSQGLAEDEAHVYLHLFNAQGRDLKRWPMMITQNKLSEYGFNRPIYSSLEHVRALLKSKSSLEENAYLVIKIKKSDIEQDAENTLYRDALDHPLLKLKEGTLKMENIETFVHMEHEYEFNAQGQLSLKHS
ncbi:MAG: type IVB secretion system protein IcmQ [Gammaproteobacteria bacterium]